MGLISGNLRLILFGLTAMAITGAGWWAYDWAYDRGYAARDAQIAKDTIKKQARIDALTETLAAREGELTRANAARTDLERMLADEADQDPLGRDPGLGADSLRRLNQIR